MHATKTKAMFVSMHKNSDVHKRTTRQTCKKDLYITSKARLNVFRNTIRYSGAHIWNNLLDNKMCHLLKC